MSLVQRVTDVVNGIAADIKSLRVKQGDLTALSTTQKASLVGAINELHTLVGSAGAAINDSATNGNTTETWSADKIFDTIEAAKLAVKNDLVAGAGAALDTLSELGAALGNNPTFAATVATDLGNRVRFDSAQVLTVGQKAQACANIGVGDPETDFVALYNTAKA